MNRINNNKNKRKKNNKKNENNKSKNQVKDIKENENQYYAPKKKNNKKNTLLGKIKKIFILILLIIIILGVIFCYKVKENGGGIKGALIIILGLSVEEVDNLDTINILLLGISEDLDSQLTDTIILCSYNPQSQKASMISIPRDTFVGTNQNKAKGSDKINALYSKDPEKLLETVSDITGIDVNYYAVVNTNALIEIVDIIGGVEFDVPIDMDYDDPTQDLHIHLEAGVQIIDGEKAEQLLRFRHNNDGTSYPASYGDNDYGRMKTQRDFITETVKQTINIKNLLKVKTIINTVFDNIETNLEMDDILAYIPNAIDFNTDNIISEQLPGESQICNNLWFFIYDKKETSSMIKNLQEEMSN